MLLEEYVSRSQHNVLGLFLCQVSTMEASHTTVSCLMLGSLPAHTPLPGLFLCPVSTTGASYTAAMHLVLGSLPTHTATGDVPQSNEHGGSLSHRRHASQPSPLSGRGSWNHMATIQSQFTQQLFLNTRPASTTHRHPRIMKRQRCRMHSLTSSSGHAPSCSFIRYF